ncbi:4'-phosphopantetheinyl transferase family protein [bacterium]
MMIIYTLKCPETMDEDRFQSLLQLTSPEKQEKILRYRKPENAYQVLWADLLIRALMMECTGLANHKIVFGKNRFNKPFLQTDPSIHFNLSHSGEWILCAVDTQPVGVDIEKIEPIQSGLIPLALSSHETETYNALSSQERSGYFYSIWTAKESYLKTIGTGLDCLPNTLSVQFDQSNLRISSTKDNLNKGYGRKVTISTGYKAVVCSLQNQFPCHTIQKKFSSVIQAFG